MTTDERFKEEAEYRGFEVGEAYTHPRDMKPVTFRGVRLFNIPAKMYPFEKEEIRYQTVNMPARNLHICQFRLRMEWYKIHSTQWFADTLKEMANQKFNPHEYEVSEQN